MHVKMTSAQTTGALSLSLRSDDIDTAQKLLVLLVFAYRIEKGSAFWLTNAKARDCDNCISFSRPRRVACAVDIVTSQREWLDRRVHCTTQGTQSIQKFVNDDIAALQVSHALAWVATGEGVSSVQHAALIERDAITRG